jgi:hypothetical protein
MDAILCPSWKDSLDEIFTDVFVATHSAQYSAIVGNGLQVDFDKHGTTNAIQILFSG